MNWKLRPLLRQMREDGIASTHSEQHEGIGSCAVAIRGADGEVACGIATQTLVVSLQTHAAKVQAAMPRIVDNLQGYLRELRPEELKGSAGAYRLKEEMLTRINLAVAPARVNAVLFKELQVQ